jgi:hypothetical protein
LSLYLNFFVGVAQAFQKPPALQKLTSTQPGPPFMVAQSDVLAFCLGCCGRFPP